MLYYSLTSFCMLHLIVVSALDCYNRTDCLCCIEQECKQHPSYNELKYYCPKGCIDGYRGAQCSLKCSESCKACEIDNKDKCTKCFDGYFLGQRNGCGTCPTNCKTCTSTSHCNECKEGFYNKGSFFDCRFASCPTKCVCEEATCVTCRAGFYNTSLSCESACHANCASCSSRDVCTKCHNGYYSGYQFDQQNNDKSEACGHYCRKSCISCISYNKCTQCNEGSHGPTCEKKCSIGCDTKNCSLANGECDCRESFIGTDCTNCTAGKYGLFCNRSCPSTCMNGLCDKNSGDCIFGCVNNNFIGNRCSECTTGMFGNMCDEACSDNCKNIACERNSGKCLDGCTGNFNGLFCKDCVSGKFGPECKQDCPERCLDGICQKDSGRCLNCDKNFAGTECNICKPRFYGSNCKTKCSQHCFNSTCDQITGNCNGGCKGNFSGDKCCIENGYCSKCATYNTCKGCKTGYFGLLCKKECPIGCDSNCNITSALCESCDFATGICYSCKHNMYGKFCNATCSSSCKLPHDANVSKCESKHGNCLHGCVDGYFGQNCNESCNRQCIDRLCKQDDGKCTMGCYTPFDSHLCSLITESQKAEDSKQTTIIVMGVIITLLVVVVISLIVSKFVVWKRQSAQRSREDTDISFKHATSPTNMEHKRDERMPTELHAVYYNVMEENEDSRSQNLPSKCICMV